MAFTAETRSLDLQNKILLNEVYEGKTRYMGVLEENRIS